MPLARMPFLTIQKSWPSENPCVCAPSRSGGFGFIPSAISIAFTPGAPWQGRQFEP